MFKFLWQRDKEMQSLTEIIAVDGVAKSSTITIRSR